MCTFVRAPNHGRMHMRPRSATYYLDIGCACPCPPYAPLTCAPPHKCSIYILFINHACLPYAPSFAMSSFLCCTRLLISYTPPICVPLLYASFPPWLCLPPPFLLSYAPLGLHAPSHSYTPFLLVRAPVTYVHYFSTYTTKLSLVLPLGHLSLQLPRGS